MRMHVYITIIAIALCGHTYSHQPPSLYLAALSQNESEYVIPHIAQAGFQILEHESAISATHFCFYHAMETSIFINILATTYLDHIIQKTPLSDTFIKLRCDQDLYQENLPLETYIQYPIHDHEDPYRRHLLAVNTSFPGCLEPGESTLAYFAENVSIANSQSIREHIISQYATTKRMKQRLRETLEQYEASAATSPCGALLQICIPHHLVNQCVYMCHPLGTPLHVRHPYRKTHKAPDTKKILTHLQKKPTILRNAHLEPLKMQARIRLDHTLFSQPGWVHIHPYHALSSSLVKGLYHDIQSIVQQEHQYPDEPEENRMSA